MEATAPNAVLDWKARAMLLRAEGKSEREIAEELGKSRSTIHEAVKDVVVKDEFAAGEVESNGHGEIDPGRLAELAGDSSGDPIPGQLDVDGGEVPAGPQPVEEIRVDGTTQLGLIDFGGKRVQTATIKFTGGKVELQEGRAFKKGDRVRFEGEAVVNFVGAKDSHDPQTGIVTTAEQRHEARITDLIVRPAS